MTSKQESSPVYPDIGTVPAAPPQYDSAIGPPQMEPQQVFVVQQPAQNLPNFGPQAARVTCPSCHATNMSDVRYESSSKTHIIATILCVTTCCCCIPYCIDSCKNANHHCSSCGAYLGTYAN